MYTEKEYQAAMKQWKTRVGAIVVLILAVLAAVIALISYRMKIPAMAAGVAGFALCYFLYAMKVSPWVKYRRFLIEMKNGQRKSLTCAFVRVSPETLVRDGVEVHELIATVGTEIEDERLFYWDADKKPLPKLEKGQTVEITSFGNFVVDLKTA